MVMEIQNGGSDQENARKGDTHFIFLKSNSQVKVGRQVDTQIDNKHETFQGDIL